MDPIFFVLIVAYVSMLPYVWLYATACLLWGWGRPPLTCGTESVGVAPRCVYGFRRFVSGWMSARRASDWHRRPALPTRHSA